jgi:hypothetical protein
MHQKTPVTYSVTWVYILSSVPRTELLPAIAVSINTAAKDNGL